MIDLKRTLALAFDRERARGFGNFRPCPIERVQRSAFYRRVKMKGNNQLPNAHFKKDWQGNTINGQCRVRTWLNQGTSRARSETRLRD